MDKRTIKRIKADFRRWSGGFSPESGDQITVYIDYALHRGIDRDEAREMLWEWMESEADSNLKRNTRE